MEVNANDVEFKIVSIIPLKNQLEVQSPHEHGYYKLPHDQKASDFKVGDSINLKRSETGPAHFLSVKSSLEKLKIGGSVLVTGDKSHIIKDLIKNLETAYHEHQAEQGGHRSRWKADEIQKEWFEDQCDKEGLNEAETKQVMDGLGY
jgi:hypothetical protein